ncbi:hypothetical protein EYF80_040412 [Liparis tanakae]|uniref:Uncharacterized protein n=1 Tax=Liparis tanakae TaxID=230148 RepID=A0A4Z2G8B5_9TELE|nr:hypothetical protein EYF80_040412 [Liparis tanakae]
MMESHQNKAGSGNSLEEDSDFETHYHGYYGCRRRAGRGGGGGGGGARPGAAIDSDAADMALC